MRPGSMHTRLPDPIALVAGGAGAFVLQETVRSLPLPPGRIWCAAATREEAAAIAGLAQTILIDTWEGASQALNRLAGEAARHDWDAPMVLLNAGTKLRRGFLTRAVRHLDSGAGIVIGTRGRFSALRLRLRLRWLGKAELRPGGGMVARGGTLMTLRHRGWLDGTPVKVSDVTSLSGDVSVMGRAITRLQLPSEKRLSVTVLIPAHNERAWIGRCIRSVLSQTEPPEQILVVDDASDDGTGEVARSLGVRVVRPPVRQGRKGAALNAGLPLVTTDMVVVLDADTTLHPEALALLERSIAAGRDAVTGAVFPLNETGLWSRGRSIEYSIAAAVHKRLQLSFDALMVLSGCIAAYRCDTLRRVGGFPDRTVGEDMDATWTLQLAGGKLGYVPQAVAYTVEPTSWNLYKNQMRRWAAAFFQNLAIHRLALRRRPGLAFLAVAALWDIVSAPLALVVTPVLVATGAVRPGAALWLFPLLFVTFAGATASYYLGVGRTLRALPGFTIISLTNSYFFFEAFIREWLLRRTTALWIKGH